MASSISQRKIEPTYQLFDMNNTFICEYRTEEAVMEHLFDTKIAQPFVIYKVQGTIRENITNQFIV
jgi:hypothetical protein